MPSNLAGHLALMPLGEGVMRDVARVCSGKPHVTLRLYTMANRAEAVLTIAEDTTSSVLHTIVSKLFCCQTTLMVPGERHAMEPVNSTVSELAKGTRVVRVFFRQGNPHVMEMTKLKDEYTRGDMFCPECSRVGPCRYTSHMFCSECKNCGFCCLVKPFCSAEEKKAAALGKECDDDEDEEEFVFDEDMTDEQKKRRDAAEAETEAARQMAEKCASDTEAGLELLENFYEWQMNIMNPGAGGAQVK